MYRLGPGSATKPLHELNRPSTALNAARILDIFDSRPLNQVGGSVFRDPWRKKCFRFATPSRRFRCSVVELVVSLCSRFFLLCLLSFSCILSPLSSLSFLSSPAEREGVWFLLKHRCVRLASGVRHADFVKTLTCKWNASHERSDTP